MPPTQQARPLAYEVEWDIKIRELTLLRREQVTPRLVRVTLGGPQIAGFESHIPDEHVKLVLPDPETGATRAPEQDGDHLDWPSPFPPTRDYTVRRYDRDAGEIDLDVVVHDGGRASGWAQEAEPGSTMWVAGPRGGVVVPPDFTYLVLLGDQTALPAIARWLEELPDDARGVAVIEVPGAAEQQPLRAPAGFDVRWLHTPPGRTAPCLLDAAVAGITLPPGEAAYLWAAGEAGALKPVRKWARANGFGKGTSDVSGYWRAGVRGDEDGNLDDEGLVERLREEVRHGLAHLLRREH